MSEPQSEPQSADPTNSPKPKMSRGKKVGIWAGSVFVVLVVIGVIVAATGSGKKQDTASTTGAASTAGTASAASASPTVTHVAAPSGKPSPGSATAASHSASHSAAPTVPVTGGNPGSTGAPSAPAATTGDGNTAVPKSAGPLGAYVGNGNDLYCDQTTAYYKPDSHGGVYVQVYFTGSGVLTVNATSKDGKADTSQEYTEGTQGATGHRFDLTGLAPDNVKEIDFGVTSPQGDGDCQVQPIAQ